MQCLHQHGHAAGSPEILGHIFTAGLQRRDVGRLLEDLSNVFQLELYAALIRHGRQVERCIGRAARGCHNDCGILKGFARADIARAQAGLDESHHGLAGLNRIFVAIGIWRRESGREWKRETDRFGDASHCICGKLTATGAIARTSQLLERVQLFLGHVIAAGRMRADGFEHVHDCDVLALEAPRQDRATIEEDRRHVEAQHGHHHARQRLVAPGNANQGIIAMTAHGQLDGICNDFA